MKRWEEYALTAALALIIASVAMDSHCSERVSISRPAALYLGLGAADYASTQYALQHGAVEGNPLMVQHMALKHLGLAAATTYADVQLQRRGHRGWAKGLRVGVFVLRVVSVGINVRNARRK